MIVDANKLGSILFPAMWKIIDLQKMYSQDMAKPLGSKDSIIKAIDAVENDTYCAILQMRYVQYTQSQRIVDALSYKLRHVYQLLNIVLETTHLDDTA